MITAALLKKIYAKRRPWSHKGNFGRLLVVGGSGLYSGSPIFNALAAYRSGCDLVKIASPEQAAAAIKAYSPDMIALPLKGDFLQKKHVKAVLAMQKHADAMVIGGGLTRTQPVLSAVKMIVRKTEIPAVIDADALHAVKGMRLKKNFILTPNSYEFFVLSGKKVNNNIRDRSGMAKKAAQELNCVILLKGHADAISDGLRTETNSTGNAFMTKGGFGDTLAGICGSLLARGVPAFEAACAAAFINGKAGDLAARKYGEGTLASDLLDAIPSVVAGK